MALRPFLIVKSLCNSRMTSGLAHLPRDVFVRMPDGIYTIGWRRLTHQPSASQTGRIPTRKRLAAGGSEQRRRDVASFVRRGAWILRGARGRRPSPGGAPVLRGGRQGGSGPGHTRADGRAGAGTFGEGAGEAHRPCASSSSSISCPYIALGLFHAWGRVSSAPPDAPH